MKARDVESVKKVIGEILRRRQLWEGMYDAYYIHRFFRFYDSEYHSILLALEDWDEMNDMRQSESFLGEGI